MENYKVYIEDGDKSFAFTIRFEPKEKDRLNSIIEALQESAMPNDVFEVKEIRDRNIVCVKNNKDFFTVEFPESSEHDVKSLALKSKGFKVKRPTWQKERTRLAKEWKDQGLFVRFFANISIIPFLATIRYFLSDGRTKEASRKLDHFLQDQNVTDHSILIRLLKKQSKFFESDEAKIIEKIYQEGQSIQEVLFNTTKLESYCKGLAFPSTLPLGYYEGTTFIPILATFTQAGDKINISVVGLPSGDAKALSEGSYTVPASEFPSLLEKLIVASVRPEQESEIQLTSEQIRKREDLATAGSKPPEVKQEASSKTKSPFAEWVLLHKGTINQEALSDKSQDSLKLLLRHLKETPENELRYCFDLLDRELEMLLTAFPVLTTEAKQAALEDFNERAQSLQRNLSHYLGHQSPALDQFNKRMKELAGLLEKERMMDISTVQKGVLSGLKVGTDTKLGVKSTEAIAVQKSAASEAPPPPLLKFEVTGSLTEFFKGKQKEIDQLVEKGKFQEAFEMSEAVLRKVPTPRGRGDNYENYTFDQLDELGGLIADVSKLQWECFVRQHRRYLEPDQLATLMNTRAALVRIARKKSSFISRSDKESLWTILNDQSDISALKKKYSYQQLASVLFDPFSTDTEQMLSVYRGDVCYRLGKDASLHQMAENAAFYLMTDEAKGTKGGDPLRLDTGVGRGEVSSFEKSDNNYLYSMSLLGHLYYGRKLIIPGDGNTSDPYWKQTQRGEKEQYLPNEIIDLRRHGVMFQSMFMPESSFALSFSGAAGPLAALGWFKDLEKKALQTPDVDPDERFRDLAFGELAEKIDEMGRLEIATGAYVVNQLRVLRVVSKKDPSKKIEYVPWGLGIPRKYKIKEEKDALRANPLVGNLPRQWLTAQLGAANNEEFGVKSERLDEPVKAMTEVGHLARCIREAKGSVIDEYLMRTLNSKNPRIALLNAMDVIRNRPDLLEDPQVQNRLEMIFLQISAVNQIDQPVMDAFSQDLKKIIEQKIEGGRSSSAAFLMHLGSVIARRGCPGYETAYFDKKGYEHLRVWMKDQAKDQLDLQFRYADYLLSKDRLSVEEKSFLIGIHSIMDVAAFEKGLPLVNLANLKKLRYQLLPSLETDPSLQQVLSNYAGISGAWTKAGSLYRNGSVTVNLYTGVIERDGKPELKKAFQVDIPKDFTTSSPLFMRLFGTTKVAALVTRGKGPNSWVYRFEKDQVFYEVNYNSQTKIGVISRQIGGQMYQFVPYEQTESEGVDHLISEYGMWVGKDNPKKGYLIVDDQKFIAELDTKGRIEKLKTEEGLVVVPDQKGQALQFLKFTHPNHILLLRKEKENEVSEIRLLDLKLTLKKEGNQWRSDRLKLFTENANPASKESLERLQSAIGKEFIKMGVPFTNSDGSISLMIAPHPIIEGKIVPLTSTEKSREKQPLELKVDQKGMLQGSSGTFLYLAEFFASNKDYPRALQFLALAEKNKIENPMSFKMVSEMVRAGHPQSKRALAWHLKLELALIRIEQQQQANYLYRDEGEYFDRIHQIADLFDRYMARAEKPGSLIEQDLLLNDKEIEELQALGRQGFRQMLVEFQKARVEQISQKAENLVFQTVKKEEVTNDFKALVGLLAKKGPHPKNQTQMSPTELLSYFCDYFNRINEGEIKEEDLKCLIHPYSNAEAELARRILLQLAVNKGDLNLDKGYKLSELQDMAKGLPKAIRGGGKVAVGWTIASEAFKIFVRERRKFFAIVDRVLSGKDQIKFLSEISGPLDQALEQTSKKERFALSNVQVAPKESGKQREVDVDAVKAALEKMRGNLTKAEIHYLENAIEEMKFQKDSFELGDLLQMMAKDAKISLLELKRESEVQKQIEQAEKSKATAPTATLASTPVTGLNLISLDRYFEKAAVERIQKIERACKSADFHDAPGASEIEKEENRQIRSGLVEAEKQLKEAAGNQRPLKSEEKHSLQERLKVERQSLFEREAAYRKDIFGWLEKNGAAIPNLKKLLEKRDLYSDQEILEAAFDLYQSAKKQGSQELKIEEIEGTLTTYLYIATALQQVESALGKLEAINYPATDSRWQEATAEVFEILSRGLNFTRYQDGNGKLVDPLYTRKYLVAEYRSGRILRDGQVTYIKELVRDPTQWVSLRMGLGKTTYIMPIVAKLLAEKGELPILLVPTVLKEMNLSDFDRTTRSIFGTSAEPLHFESDQEVSAAYLAGQYLHMIQVKEKEGYFVSTVDSLANVKQLLVALSEKRSAQLRLAAGMEAGDKRDQLMIELVKNEKKIFWLKKIEGLLDGKETIFFGDEVDSIFDITKEINRAMGEPAVVNPVVKLMARKVFDAILGSDLALKNQLLLGTQAGNKEDLSKIARTLLEKEFGLSGDELEESVKFCMGKTSNFKLPSDKEKREKISALKRIFTTTLPSILSLEPDVQFGYSSEDGATIVPRSAKQEIVGNRFGDEYELVAEQYLGAIQMGMCQSVSGASREFLLKALDVYQERFEGNYRRLCEASKLDPHTKKEQLAEAILQNPALASHRMDLIEKIVLDTGFIRRFNKQSTLSVQSVVTGRRVGGVTGTLNPYALPGHQVKEKKDESSTRVVEAETLIQMVAHEKEGLKTECQVFDESNSEREVLKILDQPDAVAIINEGGYGMKGLTMTQWIEALKVQRPGKTFLYIHPEKRTPYIWPAGAGTLPIPFRGGTPPPGTICLYGPADTRGTDLPIQPGKTHYFPLRTTTLQDMGQAIWSGRGTGGRHQPVWHVPSSMGVKTVAEAIEHIKNKSVEMQAARNLKAELYRISEMSVQAAREIVFARDSVEEDPDWWSEENIGGIAGRIAGRDAVYSVFQSYFIKDKSVDFEADLVPLEEVEVEKKIVAAYEGEIALLANKREELIKKFADKAGVPTRQIRPLADFIDSGYLENKQATRKVLVRVVASKTGKSEKEIELMLDLMSSPLKKIKETSHALEAQKNDYLGKKGEHQKYLPQKTVKASSGSGGTQEQVQQQQQQQQQQQVGRAKEEKSSVLEEGDRYIPPDISAFTLGSLKGAAGIDNSMPQIGNQVKISVEAEKILKMLPARQGDPVFRFCFNNRGDLMIISKNDYEQVLERGCRNRSPLWIYSPTPDGLSLVDQGGSSAFTPDPLLVAKGKFMLGYKLSDSEKSDLKKWFQNISASDQAALDKWCEKNKISAVYRS